MSTATARAEPQDVLLHSFQSLGDNCEFGLVQRYHGYEAPSLFKFAMTSIGGLVTGLRCGLRDVAALENLRIETEHLDVENGCGAFHVWSLPYSYRFHAGQRTILDEEKLKVFESKRLDFMKTAFLQSLEGAEKIFVFKTVEPIEQCQAETLAEAMRAYGPTVLLWVTAADDDHPPGSAEVISEGLMRGYIDHLAPREGPLAPLPKMISYSVESWRSVCEAAHALRFVSRS